MAKFTRIDTDDESLAEEIDNSSETHPWNPVSSSYLSTNSYEDYDPNCAAVYAYQTIHSSGDDIPTINISEPSYCNDNGVIKEIIEPQIITVPVNAEQLMYPESLQYSVQDETAQIEYEEITRAHCINCDKLIDIQCANHSQSSCFLKKDLKCIKCGQEFNFEQNLKVHFVVEHTLQNEYQPGSECLFCDSRRKKKMFQRFHAYIAHAKSHYKPDKFFCGTCSEEFEYYALFTRHHRLAHPSQNDRIGGTNFSNELGFCPQCGRMIPIEQCASHRLLHSLHQKIDRKQERTAEKMRERENQNNKGNIEEEGLSKKRKPGKQHKHSCMQCNKAFRRPAELRRHQAVHDNVLRWKCGMCEKGYAHQSGLLAHKKAVHSLDVNVRSCRICGQNFIKLSNLHRHIKTQHPLETRSAVVDCPECPCVFATNGALNRHRKQVHATSSHASGIGLFECEICHRVFNRSFLLKRHRHFHNRTELPSSKPHKCNRCEKRFNLKSTLKLHLDVHSRREIDDPVLTDPKCSICLKHLSSRNALRKHMLIHENNYECPQCFQKFSTIHRLDKHRCVPLSALGSVVEGEQLIELSAPNMEDVQRPPGILEDTIAPSKAYYCRHCPLSFYSFKAFKEHNLQHQGLKPHLCWTCHKSFRTAELLSLHKEIHSREPIYCEFCPLILHGRVQYNQHVRAVHQSGPLENTPGHPILEPDRNLGILSSQSFPGAELTGRELAEELFQTRAQSVDRIDPDNENQFHEYEITTTTVPDRPIRCSVCQHLYDSIAHLTNHWNSCVLDVDHSFSVIQCPLCEKSARGAAEAAGHLKTVHPYVDIGAPPSKPLFVTGPSGLTKPHQCSTCSASFNKPSDLTRHIRTHTGERPFVCDVCNRAFSVRSSLNAHIKTHSRGAPEETCIVCSAAFYTKSALALHLRIHTGERPLKCRYCAYSFRTSSDRLQHESNVHDMTITQKNNQGNHSMHSLLHKQECVVQVVIPPVPEVKPPLLLPVKQRLVQLVQNKPAMKKHQEQLIDTMAQISALPAAPIKLSSGSAFGPVRHSAAPPISIQMENIIYITAKRISVAEYSVIISRSPVKSIRKGIDTTASVSESTVRASAAQNAYLRLHLCDTQILSVLSSGILKALEGTDSVLLRARPALNSNPSIVELLPPPQSANFIQRCDICEQDFLTKEASDAHFSSEDHETAQLTLSGAVPDPIDLMIPAAIPQPRKEERTDFTCKLCGRKYLDMEPLVAHIRRDHERDHPQNLAPRPAARTAPIH